ncbi:MAG: hypothetical protein GF401_09865 [Chitinivibrionales bacterium]|nr:hypothetical protein [Chitinivibrionales bacterium]
MMKKLKEKHLYLALVFFASLPLQSQNIVSEILYPDQNTTFYLGDTVWIKWTTKNNQKGELECKLAVEGMNYNNYPRVGHADPWNRECTMNGSIPANSQYFFEYPWVVSTTCKCINVTGVQLGSECSGNANGSEKQYWWMKDSYISNGLNGVRVYMRSYESGTALYSDVSFNVDYSQQRPGGPQSFSKGQAVTADAPGPVSVSIAKVPGALTVAVARTGLVICNAQGEAFDPGGRRINPNAIAAIKSTLGK